MESHEAGPSVPPTGAAGASSSAELKAMAERFRKAEEKADKREADAIDRDVRAAALQAACTLWASLRTDERHVIILARTFEKYIRNG